MSPSQAPEASFSPFALSPSSSRSASSPFLHLLCQTPVVDVRITPVPVSRICPVVVFGCPVVVFGCPVEVSVCQVEVSGCPVEVFGCPVEIFGCPVEVFGCPVGVSVCPVEV